MKKRLLSVFAIALFASLNTIQAQKQWSLSVKGTPQLTWMHNSDDNDLPGYESKSKFAGNFGLGVEYSFTEKFGIGLDALYSLQRRKFDYAGTSFNQKNDYIKVPLYASYRAPLGSGVAFVGKLGPQLSILTNSELKAGNLKTDTKDRYKDLTFGGVANAGVEFALSKNILLSTAARFDYDFTNAEDKDFSGYTAGRAKTYNSTLGLEIGLKYRLH
ncbi:MAG: porin family protein [Chitinophagaceae bacterium]|nr:MAG: porin family protein [Chitinophagaceae bacterium]